MNILKSTSFLKHVHKSMRINKKYVSLGYHMGEVHSSTSPLPTIMDPAVVIEQLALTRQRAMNAVIDLGDSPVQQFYRGATLLVTGGSGFLGKQLIEKLFRSTQIKKIFMVIRNKKGNTSMERISTVLKDPIFDLLHKNQPDFVEKIIPIEGDVAEPDLGIGYKDMELIIKEVDIIFHAAANVSLKQNLKTAILTNVRGTRDLIKLAKQCKNLKSFLYVSTAFSNATISRVGKEIKEDFYPVPVSPDLMIELAESTNEDLITDITDKLIRGWVNTYTFSKVLAEDIVRANSKDLPIKVIRPTVVICADREPNPGWIDISSVFGPSGLILGSMMGVMHVVIGCYKIRADMIPSDYVANAAIAIAATTSQAKVYQISSFRNSITWGQLTNTVRKEVTKIPSPNGIWYSFAFVTSNIWVYKIQSMILHKIPGYIADAACVLMGIKPRFTKIYYNMDNLQGVLQFFTTHDWMFLDNNTEELYKSLDERDRAIYHFDVADIDWPHQIRIWSVGLRKYIIKDGLKDTAVGLKKQLYFKVATFVIVGILGLRGLSVLNVIWNLYFRKSLWNLFMSRYII